MQKTNLTAQQMFEQTVRRFPHKVAIVLGDRRVTYAEIERDSNKLAHALLAAGIKKGDRIVNFLPNSPEYVVAYFGIVKTGAIAVPLDAKYKGDEFTALLNNCQPRMVIALGETLKHLGEFLSQFKSIEFYLSVGESDGRSLRYEDIMLNSPSSKVDVDVKPEDIAHLGYASGPTIRPTGVIVRHGNMVREAIGTSERLEQTDKDVVMLFALPLYHAFGLVVVLMNALYCGSTLVIVPGTGLSIGSLLKAVEKEKGTMLLGVPYIFSLLNKIARKEGVHDDVSSVRVCFSGGGPLSINTIRQFKKLYGLTLVDFYGMTEAMGIVSSPPLSRVKLGSVGTALPGFKIKIVDDSGKELPVNQVGEVALSGLVTEGYYNNPEFTAKKVRNDWLYTGDMGRLDKDGYLYLTGLKKRMIILKGKKIYPSDIEAVLSSYPKIATARVVGLQDKLRGEMVTAIVLLKESMETSAQELRRFCQEHMADYKTPRKIFFITRESLSNLSKLASNKLTQKKLKEDLSIVSLHQRRRPQKA